MTDATAVNAWVGATRAGLGDKLRRDARAYKPRPVELEAAPYVHTFERQARLYTARALEAQTKGDRAAALLAAKHAARSVENLSRLRAALDSILTSC